MTEPKERPVLFSAPMVRAIIAGIKTQTRRVVKPQPPHGCHYAMNGNGNAACCLATDAYEAKRFDRAFVPPTATSKDHLLPCPYGSPGDRLWVREGYCPDYFERGKHGYRADWTGAAADLCPEPKWKPSIYMPRAASRITLEVRSVRVERVQEITQADAITEGARKVVPDGCERGADGAPKGNYWSAEHPHPCEVDPVRGARHCLGSAQMAFASLWDSINGEREGCSWDDNPWVWVVSFSVVEVRG